MKHAYCEVLLRELSIAFGLCCKIVFTRSGQFLQIWSHTMYKASFLNRNNFNTQRPLNAVKTKQANYNTCYSHLRHLFPISDFGLCHEKGVQDGDIIRQHGDIKTVLVLEGGRGTMGKDSKVVDKLSVHTCVQITFGLC